MAEILSRREKLFFKQHQATLIILLKDHVKTIDEMLSKSLMASGATGPDLKNDVVNYTCRQVALRIFVLKSYEDIASGIDEFAIEMDAIYLAYVDDYFSDRGQNVAVTVVKIIMQYGNLEEVLP